jgi:hypothetical protein
MKKIGEYTLQGSIDDSEKVKIRLFDGKFETGFRVVEFVLFPMTPASANSEVYGVLATEEADATSDWTAYKQTQIGWASVRTDGAYGVATPFSLVNPDNLIVEDLWIFANDGTGSSEAIINYYIKMEKYKFSDSRGALAMVRNKSQA